MPSTQSRPSVRIALTCVTSGTIPRCGDREQLSPAALSPLGSGAPGAADRRTRRCPATAGPPRYRTPPQGGDGGKLPPAAVVLGEAAAPGEGDGGPRRCPATAGPPLYRQPPA